MREDIKKRIEAVCRGEVPGGYGIERAMLYPNDWGAPVPLNTVLTENKDRNEDLRFDKPMFIQFLSSSFTGFILCSQRLLDISAEPSLRIFLKDFHWFIV